MRDQHEQDIALQCLDLAIRAQAIDPIEIAGQMLAFTLGADTDDAKEALAAVARIVSPEGR